MRRWVGHVDQETLQHYTHIADTVSHAAMRRLETAAAAESDPTEGSEVRTFPAQNPEQKNGRFSRPTAKSGYRTREFVERRARDSNPQPLAGHHISSVAASHSLTLRNDSQRFYLTLGGRIVCIRLCARPFASTAVPPGSTLLDPQSQNVANL